MFTLVHGRSARLAINGFSQEDEEERDEEPEECWLQTDTMLPLTAQRDVGGIIFGGCCSRSVVWVVTHIQMSDQLVSVSKD